MQNITYYIGAGASFGKRDDVNNFIILEGLPIVSEIPSRMKEFRETLNKMEIDETTFYLFNNINYSGNDIKTMKVQMLKDWNQLYYDIIKHATIDTYAKKLFLTKQKHAYNKLKNLLCAYLLWEQLMNKCDQRYDTFLANILSDVLRLPNNINVISWNYDSQFEIAYRAYSNKGSFSIFDKNGKTDLDMLGPGGYVFKVNGSATYSDTSFLDDIKSNESLSIIMQILLYYSSVEADTSQLGFHYSPHISFAWEKNNKNENMMLAMSRKIEDTDVLVVIGYSFPFFNREVDREIFKHMPKLHKIYIQDINPKVVESSIRAVLEPTDRIDIECIYDCSNFYLPREM